MQLIASHYYDILGDFPAAALKRKLAEDTLRYARLFPAQIEGVQVKAVDSSRFIEKRALRLLRACDLKPTELEYAAFTAKHPPLD